MTYLKLTRYNKTGILLSFYAGWGVNSTNLLFLANNTSGGLPANNSQTTSAVPPPSAPSISPGGINGSGYSIGGGSGGGSTEGGSVGGSGSPGSSGSDSGNNQWKIIVGVVVGVGGALLVASVAAFALYRRCAWTIWEQIS